MNRFLLGFIFCLSLAACVTKSPDAETNEVPASKIKNYKGGIYLGTKDYNNYDDDGNNVKPRNISNIIEIYYAYHTIYIDTTLSVKAQEMLSIKAIAAKDSEEARKIYADGLIEIELTEKGRIELMNLSMANMNKTMYLVLDKKILAELNFTTILADPILQMQINGMEQFEDAKAFLGQKD